MRQLSLHPLQEHLLGRDLASGSADVGNLVADDEAPEHPEDELEIAITDVFRTYRGGGGGGSSSSR